MDTREKILDEALKLFSQHGYDAVSIRQIAGAVGIKESSLYYHFKNKQAIFDTLVDFCFQKAEAYFRRKALPFDERDDLSIYSGIGLTALTGLIFDTFRYFFDDPYNVMFRRLLLISQHDNQAARRMYRSLYRDYCVRFQSRVFAMLMETGEIRKEDPVAVAMEFYAVPFLLMHTCDNFEEAKPALEEHVRQFVRNYHVSASSVNFCGAPDGQNEHA